MEEQGLFQLWLAGKITRRSVGRYIRYYDKSESLIAVIPIK